MKKSTLTVIALCLSVLLFFTGCSELSTIQIDIPNLGDPSMEGIGSDLIADLYQHKATIYSAGRATAQGIKDVFGIDYRPEVSRWMPTRLIRNEQELSDFYDAAGSKLGLDVDYDRAHGRFVEALPNYGSYYFAHSVLLVGYFTADSMGEYAVNLYAQEGNTMTFCVGRVEELRLTQWMDNGFLMVVELPIRALEGIQNLRAFTDLSMLADAASDAVTVTDKENTYIFKNQLAAEITDKLGRLTFNGKPSADWETECTLFVTTPNGRYGWKALSNIVYSANGTATCAPNWLYASLADYHPSMSPFGAYTPVNGIYSDATFYFVRFGLKKANATEDRAIVRIDSAEELEKFARALNNAYREWATEEDIQQYIDEAMQALGENFFETNSLFLTYITSDSTSVSYTLTDAYVIDGTLTVHIAENEDSPIPVKYESWKIAYLKLPKENLPTIHTGAVIIE